MFTFLLLYHEQTLLVSSFLPLFRYFGLSSRLWGLHPSRAPTESLFLFCIFRGQLLNVDSQSFCHHRIESSKLFSHLHMLIF